MIWDCEKFCLARIAQLIAPSNLNPVVFMERLRK